MLMRQLPRRRRLSRWSRALPSCRQPAATLRLLRLEDRVTPAISLQAGIDGGGNLVVVDFGGFNNNLTITFNGANYVITDAVEQFVAAPPGGFLNNANKTLNMPAAAFAGKIIVQANNGADALTADWTVQPLGRDIDFIGGLLNDQVLHKGGFDSVVETDTGAGQGNLVMTPTGGGPARTVSFVTTEALDFVNCAVTDMSVTLNPIADCVFLEDEGIPGDGLSRLRSTGPNQLVRRIVNMSGGLTVLRGTAADTVVINATPDFSKSLAIGSAANKFEWLIVSGKLTFGGGTSFVAHSSSIDIGNTLDGAAALIQCSASSISLAGTGVVSSSAGTCQIKLTADSMSLNGTGTIDATSTGTVTLAAMTSGRSIDLGGPDTGTTLGLTDEECDTITAGTLKIGDSSSGGMTITAGLNPSSCTSLELQTSQSLVGTAGTITISNLSLTAGGSIGNALGPIQTNIATLAAVTTSSGNVFLQETDALTISSAAVGATTLNVVCALGDLTVGGAVTAAGGVVNLTTTGGRILQGTGALITASEVIFGTDDGIGTWLVPVKVSAGSLSATSTTGGVFIQESDAITLTSATVGGTTLSVAAGGNITVGGTLTCTSGSLILTSTGGSILQGAGGTLSAGACTVTANGDIGAALEPIVYACLDLCIDADEDNYGTTLSATNVTSGTAGGTFEITCAANFTIAGPITAGTVKITAGGSILQGTGGKISATHLVLDSDSDCGAELARIEVETCDDGDLSSDSGSIYMHFKTSVTLLQLAVSPSEFGDCDVALDCTIAGPVSGGTVTLKSGGSILQGTGGKISAAHLVLDSDSDCGAELARIEVETCDDAGISSDSGSIYMHFKSKVTILQMTVDPGETCDSQGNDDFTIAGSITGGAVKITAGGSIYLNAGTIDASGTGSGNGGTITLWASGSCQQGNCTIVSKGGASGNGGTVSIRGDTVVDLQWLIDVTGVKGGSVKLYGDNIALGSACTINVGVGGDHEFNPISIGRHIDFGGPDSPTRLGITNAEFNRIKGGKITVGSTTAGTIFITSAINTSEPAQICWMLGSSVECPPGGSISVSTLHVSTTGNIGSLSDPLDQDCDTVDYVTKGGHVFVEDSDEVIVIATSTSPGSGDGGNVTLTAGGGLTITGLIDSRGTGAGGNIVLMTPMFVDVPTSSVFCNASGSGNGQGGSVSISAGGSISIGSAIISTGGSAGDGGSIILTSGSNLTLASILDTRGMGATGAGGNVSITAGSSHTISAQGNISASGGGGGGSISLTAGAAIIQSGSPIWGTDQTGSGGGGGSITMITTGAGSGITVSPGATISATSVSGAGGNVTLTSAGNGITLSGNCSITTNNGGDVTLRSDSIGLSATCYIDADDGGTGDFAAEPSSVGRLIDLGGPDSGLALGITDAELDRVSASSIRVGSGTAGTITITAPISPALTSSVYLSSGGSCQCSVGGSITVSSLTVTTFGNIGTIGNPLKIDVDTLSCTSNGGNIIPEDTDEVLVMFMATSPASGNGGSISLTAGGNITVAGTIDTRGKGASGNGGSVTLISSSGSILIPAIGSIDASGSGTGNGGSISLTAGGALTIESSLKSQGGGSGGGGGNVVLNYGGDLNLKGAILTAATGLNGNGGHITLNGAASDPGTGNPIYVWAFPVNASGSGSGKGGNISLSAGSIVLLPGSSLLTTGGSVILKSNNLNIDATGSCDAGGGSVFLLPHKSGWAIDLGGADSGSVLGIADVELDRIKAGSITVGSATGGTIFVTSAISASESSQICWMLGDSVECPPGGSISVSTLHVSTTGNIGSLSDPLDQDCDTVDYVTKGGHIFVEDSDEVLVAFVTTSPVSGTGGSITLKAGGSITVAGEIKVFGQGVNADAGSVVLDAELGGSIELKVGGRVDAGGVGAGQGGTVGLVSFGPVTIAGEVNTSGGGGAGAVSIETKNPGSAIKIESTGSIDTSSSTGQGGNVTMKSTGDCIMSGPINAKGFTGGGNVSITVSGKYENDLIDVDCSLAGPIGKGGNIDIQAGTITLGGDLRTEGGSGGAITLTAGTSLVQNSGQISTPGAVTVNATATFHSLGNKAGNLVIPLARPVTIHGSFDGNAQNTGVLHGKGTVGTVTVLPGGVIAPGESPGKLTTSNVVFNSGAAFAVELDGPVAGAQYDQLAVNGTVSLGSASLFVTTGYTPAHGQVFKIIDNDGTLDDVMGTFIGYGEGATIGIGPVTYLISYKGGDGNDVTLTAQVAVPTATVTFGDGTNQRSMIKQIVVTFSEAVNFASDVADAFTLFRSGSDTPTGNVTLAASPPTGPASAVTITFAGSLTTNGSLNDGFYDFTIDADQVTGIGGKLNGGVDHSVIGNTTNKYFRLFGDGNGSGVTDLGDFAAFGNAFNLGPSSIFDFGEGDNNVGLADFAQFRGRFNLSP